MGIQDLFDGKANVSGGLARSLREPEDIQRPGCCQVPTGPAYSGGGTWKIARVQEMKAHLGNIVRSCLRKKELVAGEMVRWLKKSSRCFSRGPELGSQHHTGQLTITHNSSSRQFNTLFWPPWSAAGMLKGKIITIKPQLLNNNIKSINNAS